ncbi:GAD-like domain-containing protein [Microbacterium sp. SL62]|uniref:GAD-like domain-containing protein n=1 Tax=Microbacterium sp. SL62 TaxID=2995139 RepID=UPI002274C5AB|nr:GAD-like domain-containing protein [Microbacterium sp. SL62]MCY1716889.1 GAD-like domain-containing protein [Microbacterium sp. SL62]
MPVELFRDFVRVAAVPSVTVARYRNLVEPALVELWEAHGFGLAADGFLRVIDPERYSSLIGEFLPRPDMVPVLATALGDVVVFFDDRYRVLQFRYARATGGVGSSLGMIGLFAAQESWLNRFMGYAPYAEAAQRYGALNSPADFDEIYAPPLPLPAGGPEGVEHLARFRIFEHIALAAQLAGPIPFAG